MFFFAVSYHKGICYWNDDVVLGIFRFSQLEGAQITRCERNNDDMEQVLESSTEVVGKVKCQYWRFCHKWNTTNCQIQTVLCPCDKVCRMWR